jgi:ABC-type nitrate/sulfonate/bicarbonate transport system ATPase subunit
MASKALVQITGLDHTYVAAKQHIKLFRGFGLSIRQGEVLAVVGRSGSGKTTLGSIIAGYVKPTHGKVTIDGVARRKPGKHCIVMSQLNDIFDWLTVQQNLELVCRHSKKITDCLSAVGLEDYRTMRGYELSGGMKKRLSFARAMSVDPSFLILDEPFSSLDTTLRHVLYEQVRAAVHQSGQTVMLITHDIEEALLLADRVIVLAGRPVAISDDFKLDAHRLQNANDPAAELERYALIHTIKQKLKGD